jgi:uncharacterized protein (DUF885 family)
MTYKRCKFFLLILLLFLLTGCAQKKDPAEVQTSFDKFTTELFVKEVQSDSLSLNYALSKPETYGIKNDVTTLGEFSVPKMQESLSMTENNLKKLKSYPYDLLTKDQQLTYDILKDYYNLDLTLGDYLYYNESLGPTTGIQAQLPILLAEFNFYSKDEIDQYIELLPCVYDYFKDITNFEQEKSKKGLFMNDSVADSIINQCEAFIKDPENNFLIEYFNVKITEFNGLTEEEIKSYQKRNKEAVLDYIIPAYHLLIDVLYELKGTGVNDGGLYNFPQGKDFYKCLTEYKTGSDKSMEGMIKMLDSAISNGIHNITTISLKDTTIMEKYLDFDSFPITDPDEILTDLKGDILDDFPAPVSVNCDIKYVHESLAEHLSPAMYLVPAMDNYENNNIYINGHDVETLSLIYPTVAHEGYPGHLYQCVYFLNSNPAPVRNIMNFLGYDEGWATYVELYSYHIAGIDDNLASFLESNNLVILCMYARTDIGIHYEGWSKEKAVSYIMEFINNKETAERIYKVLLEEPAVYLPYAVGCLEIIEMRDQAKAELGDQFVLKDFHQFLLDIGPASFGVIRDYFEDWLKEQKK